MHAIWAERIRSPFLAEGWKKFAFYQLIYIACYFVVYLQMSHSKFDCKWYPEDTLCTTILGQL
jgi:hypothetical protein